MVYKSKIGPIVWIPLVILMGGLSVFYLINGLWLALIGSLLIIGFLIHMIVTTYYTVNDYILNVHSGFFYNVDIDISAIKSIVETNSALSAPALSSDRIEIFFNKYDSVVISPPHKMDFIAHLQTINNNIEVKLKEKKISK
ncbi:PH domain-containing protein [Mucilaginibacter sp. UYCu711]|uniref:PH domain-containing protein n=1 Tax=Mucilaginibacter sp. UYCu711 TaxID=3156339 RepID=UPI003D1FB43B